MSIHISKYEEQRIPHTLYQNIADYPDGVQIATRELPFGVILTEGTYISLPDDKYFICRVLPVATLLDDITGYDTALRVAAPCSFIRGMAVTADDGLPAARITAIQPLDAQQAVILQLDRPLGVLPAGSVLVQASMPAASSSVVRPLGRLIGHHAPVHCMPLSAPVCVIGTFDGSRVPIAPAYDKYLPLVITL